MSGIFSLREVRTEQLANINEGLSLDIPGLLYGYFGGGENVLATNVSTIDRLDFSTETIASPVIPAKLSSAKNSLTGSSTRIRGRLSSKSGST